MTTPIAHESAAPQDAQALQSLRAKVMTYPASWDRPAGLIPTDQVIDWIDAALTQSAPQASLEPIASWRSHVEERLNSWRQRLTNRSGYRLALDDFMDEEVIEDLIGYVCDEWAEPLAARAAPLQAEPEASGNAERAARCAGACEFARDIDMTDHSCTPGHCVYAEYPDHFARATTATLADREAESGDAEDAAKYRALHTPEVADFLLAVEREALFQREKWGAEGDAGKTDTDWFWLLGYLGGKAIRPDATDEKRLHHIITTAAACLNWHAARVGAYTTMRPGIAEPASEKLIAAALAASQTQPEVKGEEA